METIGLFLPELLLVMTALAVVLSEISYRGEQNRLVVWVVLAGYFCAFLWTLSLYQSAPKLDAQSVLLADGVSIFFRLYFICLGILSTVLVLLEEKKAKKTKGEFLIFVLLLVVSLSVGVSSGNTVFIFLCTQCVNVISLGILGITANKSVKAARASFFYYLAQGLSSGLLLFGVCLLVLYGRSFELGNLENTLATSGAVGLIGFYAALFLLFFGFGVYFLGTPFYGWAKDLFFHASLPTVFILGLGLPVFGLAVLTRLLTGMFNKILLDNIGGPLLASRWVFFLEGVPVLGILFGGLFLMKARSARSVVGGMVAIRVSILLSSVLNLTQKSLGGFMLDLIPMSLSFCGIIAALFFLKSGPKKEIRMEQVFVVIFLICFMGLPPSPSFISLWLIISAHYNAGNIGLLISVFGGIFFMVYGFLRLSQGVFRLEQDAAVRYFDENGNRSRITAYKLFSLSLLAPIFGLYFLADPVITFAEQSLRFIFW